MKAEPEKKYTVDNMGYTKKEIRSLYNEDVSNRFTAIGKFGAPIGIVILLFLVGHDVGLHNIPLKHSLIFRGPGLLVLIFWLFLFFLKKHIAEKISQHIIFLFCLLLILSLLGLTILTQYHISYVMGIIVTIFIICLFIQSGKYFIISTVMPVVLFVLATHLFFKPNLLSLQMLNNVLGLLFSGLIITVVISKLRFERFLSNHQLKLTHLRLKDINFKLQKETDERKAAQKQLQAELNEAAEYIKALLPSAIKDEGITINWQFLPCSSLGGDSFGYHWISPNHLALYLIDVAGHGVGAALLSASVINAIRSQSLPDTDFFSPSQVLASLNRAFPNEEHNNMFFTIWYGVYHKMDGSLAYSSGGHPPALMLQTTQNDTTEVKELATKNMIIGALPEYDFTEATITVSKPTRLCIYSDGVYEITTKENKDWKFDEFKNYLTKIRTKEKPFLDQLMDYTRSISLNTEYEDDYTILDVEFF